MSKRNKNILLIALIITMIVIISIIILIITTKKVKDNENFANEYTNIGKNNVFVYRNSKEIIKILEGGTGLVYLGFPECPWCQAYVPMLNEVAKENDVTKIYYLNIKNIRKKNTSDYQKIVKILKNFLSKDDEGNERIYVPDVYAIRDGKILSHNNDTSMISGDISPENYWTSSRKNELKKVLKNMLDDVYSNTCKTCGD